MAVELSHEGRPPVPVWCLFSGGKDSFATACALQENNLLLGCIMLDTGISTPEWRQHCEDACRQQNWTYDIMLTNTRYEWFVWRFGFPGPAGHRYAVNYLKGRAIREYKRKYKGIALASGVRIAESSRRTINTKPIGTFETVTIYAPIYDWSNEQTWEYVKSKGYQRPPAYTYLGISGDCLCGAYAKDFEREAIRQHYPTIDARLTKLEREVGMGWGRKPQDCPVAKTADEALVCAECGHDVQ